MSILKRKKQSVDIHFILPPKPVSTWEEGRAWLREKGWLLVGHLDGNGLLGRQGGDVYLHFEKTNCVDLSITIHCAKTDLDAIQQVIAKVKAYEASVG